MSEPNLQGLVPETLRVRSARIMLESLEVRADIGFHDFEVGTPQRLLVTIEIWLEDATLPAEDDPDRAWNYDFLRREVEEIASSRRFNLQETLAHAVFERLAAFRGVRASSPDFQAGRLSGGSWRRRRDRLVSWAVARRLSKALGKGEFHAFRLWNKIRCAAFEPAIRKRACRR